MYRWKKTKGIHTKEKAASSTIMLESILITATVEAMEEREVAVIDLPGAFLHAENEREYLNGREAC